MMGPSILTTVFFIVWYLRHVDAFPRHLASRDGLNMSDHDIQHILKSRGLLGGLGSLIPESLDLAPVATVGRKRIPDEDHPFIAPGPTDIRGACPGLNIMANYGYISRDGITTIPQMLWAMEEMLGFGPDLALVLSVAALKNSVDLTTMKMSIGQTDKRTDGPLSFLFGTAPGMFSKEAHNKYERDGSLSAVDAYFENGRTDVFSVERWKRYRQVAVDRHHGLMTLDWLSDTRIMRYNECRYQNPDCHWAVIEQLSFVAADGLIANSLTSSGPDGKPLPPDVRSIDAFFGFVENSDGTFSKTHNKLPPGPDGYWYRRTVPSTAAQFIEDLVTGYLRHPTQFGTSNGTLGSFHSDALDGDVIGLNLGCYLLEQTRDPKDSRYGGSEAVLAALGTLLHNTLAPVFKVIGC